MPTNSATTTVIIAHAVVVSSEVGWKKPGREFFRAVVDTCGYRAEQVLMVGDDPVNDVEGALDSGMQAVWVDRTTVGSEGAGKASSMIRPPVIGSLNALEAWCS